MMLWLILTAIAAAAAFYVAAPFLRPLDTARTDGSSELGIYRDQLAEIDREAASGAIEPSAAEQARAEVKRRMLAAGKAATATAAARPLTPLEYRFAFLTIVGFTVLGSVILYAYNGNPGVPSASPQQAADGKAAGDGMAAPSPQLASVEEMITKLSLRVKSNPGDAKAWGMLGWAYLNTSKFPAAAESYRKAVDLDAKSANARVGLADALIQIADGKVTPEASANVDQALMLDAKEPRALFLRGLGKSQTGDAKGAIDDWIAVYGLARPDDPWASEVRQRILDLAKQAGIDVAGRLPVSQTAPAATLAGPSPAEVDAAQKMPQADRMAMIKGMVDRLAQKLDEAPRDLEGWMQLMRSRKVLGDSAGAKSALKRSLEVFADSPAEQGRLKAAAQELGIDL